MKVTFIANFAMKVTFMARATRARAVVQSWNERSIRTAHRMGFAEIGRHVCTQDGRDVEYVVLATELPPRA